MKNVQIQLHFLFPINNQTNQCRSKGNRKVINGEKGCIKSDSCEEGPYFVENTQQCITSTSCPYDNPYLFDSICYEEIHVDKN